MSQIAVDSKGNKIRWDESKKEWIPVEKAVNDKGIEIEYDGAKWAPVYKQQPKPEPVTGKITTKAPEKKMVWSHGGKMYGPPTEDMKSFKDIGQAVGSAVSGLAAFPVATAVSTMLMNPKVGGVTFPPELAEFAGQNIGGKITIKPTTPGAQAGAEALGTPFAPFSAAINAMPTPETRTLLSAAMLVFPYAKGLVKGFIKNRISSGKGFTPKEIDAVISKTELPPDVAAKISTRLEQPPVPTGEPTADAAALEAFTAAQRAKESARPLDSPGFTAAPPTGIKVGDIPPIKVGEIPGINPTPQQMLVNSLKQTKWLQPQQKALYKQERGKRVGEFGDIPSGIVGEERLQSKLGILKGELPKVDYEPLNLSQAARDALQDDIHFSLSLGELEKVSAGNALKKMIDGKFPAPYEVKLFNKVFGGELMDVLVKRMSTRQKIAYWGGQALNIPRSIMASFDLSAPLRQGVWIIGRPKEFFGSFKGMFQSFVKEANYQKVMGEIANRPSYNLMRESGLDITGVSASLKGMEEPYLGADLIERLGGMAKKKLTEKGHPILGTAVNLPIEGIRASQRAYTAFLNKARADYFDTLVGDARRLGLYDVKEKGGPSVQNLDSNPLLSEDIARYVNAATGRGKLPEVVKKGSDVINAVFFSPRLISSRLTLLNPGTYIDLPLIGRGTNKFVRHAAMRDAAAFGSAYLAVSGITALVASGKGSIGTDPKSSDFGKILVGNTSLDIMGGISQYARTGIQAFLPLLKTLGVVEEANLVSSASGKKKNIGGGYNETSVRDILMNFFTNKQSPIFSLIWDATGQRSSTGGDINVGKELVSRITPLIAQDLYDMYKDDPNALKMALIGLAITFGAGAQTYPPKPSKSFVEPETKTRQEIIQKKINPSTDPVVNELERLGVKAVLGTKKIDGQMVQEADLATVLKEAGPMVRQRVLMYMNNPAYKNNPKVTDEIRKKWLQKAVNAGWTSYKEKKSQGVK